jgi:hypothetical protein
LDAAITAVHSPTDAPEPDWVFWVDEVEVQIMSGRCWTELRQPERSVPILESALARYDETHARDKALYTTWLARSYLDADSPEQAAQAIGEAMDLAAGVGSARPGERIGPVMRRLAVHRELPAVTAVLERARA